MDYIVFGTGYGATLLLLGWVLRTFGPGLRYRETDDDAPATGDRLLHRIGWVRFAAALGSVLVLVGSALILVTFLTALINPGDDAGAIVVGTGFAAIVIGTAIWLWLYVARYGSDGLVPEQIDVTRFLTSRGDAFPGALRSGGGPKPATADVFGTSPEEGLDAAEDEALVDAFAMDDDELEVHTSRFQSHHPEGAASYHDLFDMYGMPEPSGPSVDVPEHHEIEDFAEEPESGPAEESASDGEDVELDGGEDEERSGVESEEDGDAGEELEAFVEDEPAETEVHPAASDEDVPGDDGEEQAGSGLPDDDVPLMDTPEGRAEALRRIQEWEPDEDD